MRKLKVEIKPLGNGRWKWRLLAWMTVEELDRELGGSHSKKEEGYWDAWLVVPHSLGEIDAFNGSARNEAKALQAARSCLSMSAGRLAVAEFDKALGRNQLVSVEIG